MARGGNEFMKCFFPKCEAARYSRGLCVRHYHVARGLVRVEELEHLWYCPRHGKFDLGPIPKLEVKLYWKTGGGVTVGSERYGKQ